MTQPASLDYIFNPRSVALVGASHSEQKLGGAILKNLLEFRGKVYPVNPHYDTLMGLRAYPSIKDIPQHADLSIIIRPASEAPEILRAHKDMANSAIIMSGGFAEIGRKKLQDEIKKISREIGVRMLGPNCMGVYNPYKRLDTFFLPHERLKRPKKGNVAVISQSGAILSCIFEEISAANAGISRAVGYGNAADIDESDLYEFIADDIDTDVVVSYIESVEDGRKFIDRAKTLSRKKSLIVLKAGKGPAGQAAAYSHTGKLAGRHEVFSSILRQFHIREAQDFDSLIDSVKALSCYPRKLPVTEKKGRTGNRVLIVTNGGGSGVLASDECMKQGLLTVRPPADKIKKLRKIFPDYYGLNNPVDLTAEVKDEDYLAALNELEDCYDGFLIIALTGVAGITERLAGLITGFRKKTNKPLVLYTAAGALSGRLTLLLENVKAPVYPSPERAVRGLKALLE